jgi:flagellar biosynthesis/type III secretory pathway chaperone
LSLDYNFNQAQNNRNSHNIEILYDPKGNKKVYSSYDFDLNGIWKEHYDLPEDTYQDSTRKFGVFLGTIAGNPIMISKVMYLLSKLEKIKQKIATAEKVINASANETEKKFVGWITEFEPILYEYINLNRKDHGALIDAIRASQIKSKANDGALDREE